MSEETRDTILGFWMLLAVVATLWACVRGCAIVYDPATINADTDAMLRKAEYYRTHPQPSPTK